MSGQTRRLKDMGVFFGVALPVSEKTVEYRGWRDLERFRMPVLETHVLSGSRKTYVVKNH